MANTWLGWCASDERDTLRRALKTYDNDARLSFADSAQALRFAIQGSAEPVGGIVGLTSEGVSAINVAAAIKRDGVAREVVLVVHDATQEVQNLAAQARIDRVIEIVDDSVIPTPSSPLGFSDLDEPNHPRDMSPTLIMLPPEGHDVVPANHIPHVEGERREVSLPWEDDGETGNSAVLLTFVSGRGGVGKTSLVATMAYAAASWGMRVAVLDLDLSCGNLYSMFGLPGPADLAALRDQETPTPDDILACGRQALPGVTLWGCCELPEMAEPVMPKIEGTIATLCKAHDLLLVDTSVALTDCVALAAQRCDRLLLVVDGGPGSAVAQRRLGALAVRLGIARTRMVRLANRCGLRGRGEPQINRSELGLETARPLRVLDGGMEVVECLAAGKPSDLFEIGSRFAESSASALATLLSELGRLPKNDEARRAKESSPERPKWGFGHRKAAM